VVKNIDLDIAPSSYELITYPTNFKLAILASKVDEITIIVTGFQRNYA
jgi:hypothetical protein